MEKEKIIEGKIFADLHSHFKRPSNHKELEALLEKLSYGISGITEFNRGDCLRYNELITFKSDLFDISEVEQGRLAKIHYYTKNSCGYIIKTQEVREKHVSKFPGVNNFEILAVGCSGIPDDISLKDAVDIIHYMGGLAIAVHPYTTSTGKWPIKYRLINENEEKHLPQLYELMDEVEVFNAQNIQVFPFTNFLNMNISNEKAKESIKRTKFKGIASSDAHSRAFLTEVFGTGLEQSKMAGIYLPRENDIFESLKHNIVTSNFERLEQYVDRISFASCMFL